MNIKIPRQLDIKAFKQFMYTYPDARKLKLGDRKLWEYYDQFVNRERITELRPRQLVISEGDLGWCDTKLLDLGL